jgi:hypothetical protein
VYIVTTTGHPNIFNTPTHQFPNFLLQFSAANFLIILPLEPSYYKKTKATIFHIKTIVTINDTLTFLPLDSFQTHVLSFELILTQLPVVGIGKEEPGSIVGKGDFNSLLELIGLEGTALKKLGVPKQNMQPGTFAQRDIVFKRPQLVTFTSTGTITGKTPLLGPP